MCGWTSCSATIGSGTSTWSTTAPSAAVIRCIRGATPSTVFSGSSSVASATLAVKWPWLNTKSAAVASATPARPPRPRRGPPERIHGARRGELRERDVDERDDLVRGLWPIVRLLREQRRAQAVDHLGNVLVARARHRCGLAEVGEQDLERGAFKRRRVRDELEQQATERVQIGARVDRLAVRLLR